MTCEHLYPLERELLDAGFVETYRGAAWGEGTREWVYFDCHLDLEALRRRLRLPEFVVEHRNEDPKSGTEEGFVCERCGDAIMGRLRGGHPRRRRP